MTKHKYIKYTIATLLLVIIFSLCILLLISLQQKPIKQPDNTPTPISVPVSIVSEEVNKPVDARANLEYDNMNLILPSAIESLMLSQIHSLECTKLYIFSDKNNRYEGTDEQELTDNTILDFITSRNAQLQSIGDEQHIKVINFIKCDASNGNTIYVMNESWENVMSGGRVNIALVKPDNSIKYVSTKNTSNNPYWRCNRTVGYTKEEVVYVQCGGGDGGYGESFIVKGDFKKLDANVMIHCNRSSDFMTGKSTELSCN